MSLTRTRCTRMRLDNHRVGPVFPVIGLLWMISHEPTGEACTYVDPLYSSARVFFELGPVVPWSELVHATTVIEP